jgi:hypothetical protein
VFTKKAWVFPLKTKSGPDVARALGELFSEVVFKKMQTDKGREFYNAAVSRVMEEYGVAHFSSENENIKASVVERFNRTLRGKIHTHLTATNSHRYIDVLQDAVAGYNATPHSATGMPPDDVSYDNQEEVWTRLYEGRAWNTKPVRILAVDDYVRVTKGATTFDRGYTPNWTTEIFRVQAVLDQERPIVYRVKDLNEESVAGTFYEKELQKVKLPTEFKIEKILKKRKRGRAREMFVKWMGYPDSFNSWVSEKDFV